MKPPYQQIIEDNPMPADVRKHFVAAVFDLYYGPNGPDYWREETDDPSAPTYTFFNSCQIVGDWFDSVDWPSYIDGEGYALADDDRDVLEEESIQYYEVDLRDLKHERFGELASYIR